MGDDFGNCTGQLPTSQSGRSLADTLAERGNAPLADAMRRAG